MCVNVCDCASVLDHVPGSSLLPWLTSSFPFMFSRTLDRISKKILIRSMTNVFNVELLPLAGFPPKIIAANTHDLFPCPVYQLHTALDHSHSALVFNRLRSAAQHSIPFHAATYDMMPFHVRRSLHGLASFISHPASVFIARSASLYHIFAPHNATR